MRTGWRIALTFALAATLSGGIEAQSKNKKQFAFKGKVTEVIPATKSLTVDHQSIPGWMEAMVMTYAVDKPDEVLKQVKVGDTITATVYDGDYTLYNVQVVKPDAPKKSPPKKP
jgi:Cu/Ag efflux protein CusF